MLLLRAYRLPEAIELARSPTHAGCRSWIELDTPISTQHSSPVLSEQDYQTRLQSIECAVQAATGAFRLEAYALQ